MKEELECIDCDGKAKLEMEVRKLTYRGNPVNIDFFFYKCEKCKSQFTTTETDTVSLLQFPH